jgi:hypothetical protein
VRLIPADSGTHFVVGAVFTALGLWLLPAWAVAGACLVAALLREAYGRWRHGRWSWSDVAWTMAGCAVVLLGFASMAAR